MSPVLDTAGTWAVMAPAVAVSVAGATAVVRDRRADVRRGYPDDARPRRRRVAPDEQHLELLVIAGALTPADLLAPRTATREALRFGDFPLPITHARTAA